MSFWGVSCQFFILKNQKQTTKRRIVGTVFVLFFQFCEVSKWVGDSDFLLAKFRNLATGEKKNGGGLAISKKRQVFFRKNEPLSPHYEELLFEDAIFIQ
jgi:hypothetical protein